MSAKQGLSFWCSMFLQIILVVNGVSKINGIIRKEPTAISGRVVGGKNAESNSASYIVSLQHGGIHYCAGSIINKKWIITAAHCLKSKQQTMSCVIVAGSLNLAVTSTTTQKRKVSYYVIHDLYTGGIAPYDIGLIYTNQAFQWTTAVMAVALPENDVVPTGNADLYGWGSISKTNEAKYPSILQVAKNIPILSIIICERALGSKGKEIHSTNMCTEPLSGGIGICISDSGGPLVQTNSKGKTTLIGIVSWGEQPCGNVNSPSVYVQVSLFSKWITKNIDDYLINKAL